MGAFSNKLKSLIFDKDPLGVIKKTKEIADIPAQAMRERSPAWKAGVAAAQKSNATKLPWTISRGNGERAMTVPKVVATPPSKPRATAAAPVAKSRKTFSTAKAKTKIPHYDKIPGFAKNYIRVPARTFIKDLSDTNLNRTFGPATTGTPKAKDTASFSAPKASTISSPQPQVTAQIAKTGSSMSTPGAIATGVALGLGSAAGLAYASKQSEPRTQHGRRSPVERRTTQVPHPLGEAVGAASEKRTAVRRAAGARRDPEHEQTGTKAMRGKTAETINGEYARSAYGEQGKKDYSGFRATNAANEEKRLKDLGGTRRAGDPKPRIKPKLRKAGTIAPAAAPKVESIVEKSNRIFGGNDKPAVTPPVRHGIRGNFKGPNTATAAINALPDKPKPRMRKAGTPKVPASTGDALSVAAVTAHSDNIRANAALATPPPEKKPRISKGRLPTANKNVGPSAERSATAISLEPVKSPVPKTPDTKLDYYAPGGEFDRKTQAVKAATPAPEPKVPAAEAKPEKKGFSYRGTPWPKNRGTADRVRETPGTVDSINEDPTKKVKRVRRQKEMAKGETTVGASQSLTQGVKALENADRKKALDAYVKKGKVTVLPPATKEMMEPEQSHVQTGPAKDLGYHSGRLPKKKDQSIVEAKPISTREELLAQLEKSSRENQALGGKGSKISTTGGIVAAGPPRIQVRQSKAAKAKAAMESKPPEVVKKTVLRKAGTPAVGETPKTGGIPRAKITGPGGDLGAISKAMNPPKVSRGRLPSKLGGKLGVAILAGAGAGAFMSGSEAKANTGSYAAAAKAAGKSLYESGREYAKFSTGAAIASRLPGAVGAVARFGLGKALPAAAVGLAAKDVYDIGQAGMGAFRAKRAAEKEAKGSAAKYGSVALATATRHARERAKGLRK